MSMTLNPTNVSIVKRLLVGRNSRPLKSILFRLAPTDLAALVGLLNDREVRLLFEALISIDKVGACLSELPEQKVEKIFSELDEGFAVKLLKASSPDDVAYVLSCLDEVQQKDWLDLLEPSQKRRVHQLLKYPEESAGRMMHSQFFSVPIDLNAEECLDLIRKRAKEISIYYIYCVDEEGTLLGVVSLRDLATAAAETSLSKLAKRDIMTVGPEAHSDDVAQIASRYDFVA